MKLMAAENDSRRSSHCSAGIPTDRTISIQVGLGGATDGAAASAVRCHISVAYMGCIRGKVPVDVPSIAWSSSPAAGKFAEDIG